MNLVFADTSYYIALMTRVDSRHERAVECSKIFAGRVITTQWVLSELGNYFSPVHHRKRFVGILADLKRDPNVTIVSATGANFDAGNELYADRLDKSWSLVDCISFLTMREYGITEAWTSDHHFEQAGFIAALA